MGVDNGSHVMGYAVMDGETILDAGMVKTSAKDQGQRLSVIYTEFCVLLDQHKPDIVAIETPFINPKFMNAVIPLSHSRGVLVLAVAQRGIRRMDISAPSAKAAVGAKQKGKASVQCAVQVRLSLSEAPPPDVADSMALAICAAQKLASEAVQ